MTLPSDSRLKGLLIDLFHRKVHQERWDATFRLRGATTAGRVFV